MLVSYEELSPTYAREISGLQMLGLCDGEILTYWGYWFLTDKSVFSKSPQPVHWEIIGGELHIPYPPDWGMLWKLEEFLKPIDPGVYAIDEKALRRVIQIMQGDLFTVCNVLEQGLQKSLPENLIQSLKCQPSIKVLPGLVLEFSSSDDLLELRKNISFRKALSSILSAHHVYIHTWQADQILRRLERHGVLTVKDIDLFECDNKPSTSKFSMSDKAYLLRLFLLDKGIPGTPAPPLGLMGKIIEGMPMTVRTSSVRKASESLGKLFPSSPWKPDEELPDIPEQQLIEVLENAISKQETIDFNYQKADDYQPEHRRVTPLILEQRGLRFYLIAYCHDRRANRTFRLDRLKLILEKTEFR